AQSFPLDGAKDSPSPILDRWGDTFNLQTEFVILNQARALATSAWLMAQSPLHDQPWKPAPAKIGGVPDTPARVNQPVILRLDRPAFDLTGARVVWEGSDNPPVFAREFTFTPRHAGPQWAEVEVQA